MESEDLRQAGLAYAQNLSQSMLAWEEKQKRVILEILRQANIPLKRQNIAQIIQATNFEQISSPKNSEYCPLYLKNERCHPELTDLNCCLCNCPNYDASKIDITSEQILVGRCKESSRKGFYHFSQLFPEVGVWTCEQCHTHHSREFLKKYLEKTLKK
jgi:hypothetical protein